MSVHSHTAVPHDTALPEFPRHVVTAVLVSHDGARWLPDALAGLLGQERPVQQAWAADTGSADDSARLLAESLGDDRVLHLARRTGFGQAVEEAHRAAPAPTVEDLPYLKRPSGWDPVTRTWRDDTYDLPELPYGEPEHWLWLLHDDSAPEPDALAQLLRVVEMEREAGREDVAVVGPKLRGWYDRRQLLEVGVTIANSGRRWTGLDRREQDQGQHDYVRPVLSVSTAGMLIRRDVFEELGGFDRHLPLMRDDVDLCWRVQAAGHRVLIAPDAVVRHAEAASRERRAVDCVGRTAASPHKVDKAGAVYTLLVNARGAQLPWMAVRIVVGTLLRTLAYLVGKVPGQALDEIRGLLGVLLRPERILAGRRERRGGLDKDESKALFPPPGATLRATVEQVAGNLVGRSEPEASSAGRHGGAVESGPGGDDADFLEIEQFARLKRIARRPGPVLFVVLLLVSLAACRNLLGGGALAGGALLPAPVDASELWSRYLDAWHPVGAGGTPSAPPYLALVALLASVLLGSTGLAVTLLLVFSVPLAGVTAYFASRPLVPSRLLRAWASVAYAFLPAATGALAGGRLGTAVLAVLLPLIARAGIAAAGLARAPGTRGSWRATWAYALLLTFTTAFTPIVWPIAAVLGLAVLAVGRRDMLALLPRYLVQLGVPLLVLAPWSLTLLPTGFFQEAGLDFGAGAASATDLLGASPGGPGTVSGLMLIGIVLAALAALLRSERGLGIRTAWVIALVALVFAVLSNDSTWAGPATLVYGIALLAAAALGADGARARVAEQSFGWRQPVAALIAFASAAGPLLVAVGWMIGGADGPLERRDPAQVPAFVAEESAGSDQPRTLVLDSPSAADVRYTLVRGSGVRLGDAELAAADGENARLDKVVANLVAGSGADQADELGGFAVRYVQVRKGAPREVSRVLDATPGLSRLSQRDGSALWRVDRQVSRAAIVTGSGADTGPGAGSGADSGSGGPEAVAAGPVEIHTKIPAASGSGDRILRIADTADAHWTATLEGKPLTRTTVDGWAQGFELPATGGRLDVTYETPLAHSAWLWAQGLLALVLVVLALPGRRRVVDDDMPDEPLVPAQDITGDGRRARRLRERAEAAEGTGEFEAPGGTEASAEPGAFGAFGAFGDGADGPVPGTPDDEFARPAGQGADDAAPATAAVPQQGYDTWDTAGADADGYQDAEYAGYQADPYQGGQYPQETYEAQQQPYQGDPYQDAGAPQNGQYDPYAYGGGTPYDQGYAPSYDPQAPYEQGAQYGQGDPYDENDPYGQGTPYDPAPDTDRERPHGSQQ
ncbi:GT2 family glycosyltransferase [Streptomyces sp. B3I7]|uniref:glycosyltransferase family 2 protein n=1 Tax=Streptomyces sp. B3I7 TaxID=3042269 RepID=UPI002786F339|nr:glycosyltransferase family 2 protein [Streptomyces sp. B3I7]MDQ0813062.1 GT2 family glycosyltransferase [Streptomyces sp. B3I7]